MGWGVGGAARRGKGGPAEEKKKKRRRGDGAGFDRKTCGGLSAQRGNTRQSNRMSDNTQEVWL